MKIIGQISENEMVGAFLRAEVNSERWGQKISDILNRDGKSRKIIDDPNLNDDEENEYRKKVLSEFRGYGNNLYLFNTFPSDVKWYRVKIKKEEFGGIKYMKYDYWDELSKGTRLVKEGAETIRQGKEIFDVSNQGFLKAAAAVKQGIVFPEIILVGTNEGSDLVVLEGHQRITAYQMALDFTPREIEVIVGFSPNMAQWNSF